MHGRSSSQADFEVALMEFGTLFLGFITLVGLAVFLVSAWATKLLVMQLLRPLLGDLLEDDGAVVIVCGVLWSFLAVVILFLWWGSELQLEGWQGVVVSLLIGCVWGLGLGAWQVQSMIWSQALAAQPGLGDFMDLPTPTAIEIPGPSSPKRATIADLEELYINGAGERL